MKRFSLYLISGLLLSLFGGCGPSQEAIDATRIAVVASGIEATVSAIPSQTPQPTLTQQPTLTPRPTLTSQPTLTAEPSLTPWPALTPRPTYTPLPTLMIPPTNTPQTTSIAQTGNANGQEQVSNTPFDVRHLNIIRSYMVELADMTKIQTPYYDYDFHLDDQLECDRYLGTYYAYRGRLIQQSPTGDQNIQNAFALYQQALTIFEEQATYWANKCESDTSANNSITLNGYDQLAMLAVREQALSLIDQAKAILNNANE